MKIAKKVLAVVMAVALVACFSAMAFASELVKDNASIELVLDGTDVKLYAKNCENLASANLELKFDPAVVTKVRVVSGDDAKNVIGDNFENNSFTAEQNTKNLEKVEYGFYFKACLWSSAKFAEEDLSEEANINGENFHVATFKLTLVDGKTANDVVVGLTGTVSFANGLEGADKVEEKPENFKFVGIEKAAAPVETTTEAPVETTTAAPEPSKEAPTTAAGKTDGNNKTGDTGVLAIAAGVVALAGAAFVVSKKRK